jgi:DNA anti-recombination protein RmuC
MEKELQELIGYLGKRFDESAQQIQALRDEMTREFADVRLEMTQEFANVREEMTQEFANVREEMAQGFSKAHEENRHARILIEGVHSNVRIVAEGVIGMGERMDAFREEVTTEVKNIRSLTQDVYSALERRVHTLETWRETKERDPIDIIKERFGKRPES